MRTPEQQFFPRWVTGCLLLSLLSIVVLPARTHAAVTMPAEEGTAVPPERTAPGSPEPDVRTAPSGSGDSLLPSSGSVTSSVTPTTEVPFPGVSEFFIDALHGVISKSFLSSAGWLDSFFGDERYTSESNTSYFKLRMEAFREGSAGMQYDPNFDLRLVLPQLRNKTRIEVSGDPRDTSDPAAVPSAVPAATATPETRNVTTALQYFVRSTERRSFSIKTGFKLHQGSPVVFFGPRFRYYYPMETWAFRFIEEVLWNTDKGWSNLTQFDLERQIPRNLFFRSSLQATWSQDVHNYLYAVNFLVRQPLDTRRAIEYEWVNRFRSIPADELAEILLIWRYRQGFWREWLFFEIAPQVRYPREFSFHATPGILFKLEAVFGRYR